MLEWEIPGPTVPIGAVCLWLAFTLAGCAPAFRATEPDAPVATFSVDASQPLPQQPTAGPQETAVDPTSTASPTVPAPSPTAPAATDSESVWVSPADGMRLHLVSAGAFWFGSNPASEAGEPDERPQRRLEMPALWMDETEVTWAMYLDCLDAGACTTAQAAFEPDQGSHPVVGVTFDQAVAYCSWAGRRLPTEAEWERGARGGDARPYPWGWIGIPETSAGLRLNFCDASCSVDYAAAAYDDGYSQTAPVGSFPAGASPYGLLDMAGNVWEWTADWYQATGYAEQTDGEDGRVRAIRGGSWIEPAWGGVVFTSRSANRAWLAPERSRADLGFRCVVEPGEAAD